MEMIKEKDSDSGLIMLPDCNELEDNRTRTRKIAAVNIKNFR